MCGRLSLHHLQAVYTLMELLQVPSQQIHLDNIEPHYNFAPTQRLPVLVSRERQLSLFPMTWGLLPAWAVRKGSSTRLVNARAETALQLPTFRDSMRDRRCVIIANGFFEWRRDANDKPLAPYYFHPRDASWLAMAGVYQSAVSDGSPECCVLTTSPNAEMEPVHDRMPCILSVNEITAWLQAESAPQAAQYLRPAPAGTLQRIQVSQRVNAVRNDDPSILQPDITSPQQGRLF